MTSSVNTISQESTKVFANRIVGKFEELCPASEEEKQRKKLSQKGIKKALTRFYSEIHQYVSIQKLGVIRRALLARAIQSEMETKTYERALINQVMMSIILNALINKG